MYILLAFEKKWAISDRQSRTGQDTDTGLIFQKSNVMKLSYKQKLFLYFFIIFSLFTIGIIVFAQTQERKFRTEALEEKLDAYTEITNVALLKGENLDSLVALF